MAPKPLIFLTGATGFIGSQLISACLPTYRLRLSVRKHSQISYLQSLFPDTSQSDLEFVVIPDITLPTAFRGGFDDVDYVFHLASPMPGKGSDLYTDYIDPAVKGTISALDAALEVSSVRKVVVMSSVLALAPLSLFGETDFLVKANTGESIQLDPEALNLNNGPKSNGPKYQISKILAHQASQDWAVQKKPHFVLASMHPTFVVGPSLIQKTAQEIDGINAWFWMSLHAQKPRYPSVMVDVRDVADAFLRTITAPVESGTEFILSGPKFTWKDAVELLKAEYPRVDVKLVPPEQAPFQVDVSAAEQVLGVEWRPMEDTVRDVLSQQLSFDHSAAT